MKIKTRYILILLILSGIITSCNTSDRTENEDILVKVGAKSLTAAELAQEMPYGLTESDSIKFARAYIRSWIDNKLVEEIAAQNIPDKSDIDRLVEAYRNELIMWEYRQQMYQSHANKTLSPDSIASYYNLHKNELKSTHPYIKGIYIKISDDSQNLGQLKKWYRSNKDTDIEQLEKYGLSQAIHYDYFRDRWIDWEQIESKIPYDFGTNPDEFLKNNKNLELSIGGFTYLLDITDYLPSGAVLPLEVASLQIKEILINQNRLQYDRQLRQELFDKGVEDGDIEILCDLES